MADYKRFVSYMYVYTNGIKRKNVGYARVEVRNGECRLKIYIQMEGVDEGIFPTYLIYRPGDEMDLIYIGDCVADNQLMEGRLTINENNVSDKGLKFSDMGGILLFLNTGVFYATQWDDKPIILDEVLHALKQKPKKHPAGTALEKAGSLTEKPAPAEETVFEGKKNETEEKANIDRHTAAEEIAFTGKQADAEHKESAEKVAKVVDSITDSQEEAETIAANIKPADQKEAVTEKQPVAGVNTAPDRQVITEGTVLKSKKEDLEEKLPAEKQAGSEGMAVSKQSEMPVYMLPRGFKTKEIAKPPRMEKPLNPWEQVERYKRFEEEKNKASSQSPTGKEMPAADQIQKENQAIEKIFNSFPRIYPFEDNEIKRCVKIEPKDIGTLPASTWILSNNSFLLHGYYCYHHLIFAEITDRYGCRYIIVVPGIYHNRERFMARMFGFENFKSIRKRELRQGDFGYWYQEVRL